MGAPIDIRTDFPTELEKHLIRKVCRDRNRCYVYVGHFARFGLSGARLLLLYFSRRPDSLPFLLKVAKFEKAERELKATALLKDDVQDANSAAQSSLFSATDEHGIHWGALLYKHHAAESPQSPRH